MNPRSTARLAIRRLILADASCATANSAPNGRPTTFSGQITGVGAPHATRDISPATTPTPTQRIRSITGGWAYPRPGDNLFKYQHPTIAGRDCLTCHVSWLECSDDRHVLEHVHRIYRGLRLGVGCSNSTTAALARLATI